MTVLKAVPPVAVGWVAGASVGIGTILLLNANGIYLGTIGAILFGVVASVLGMAAGLHWGSKA